MVPLKSWNLVVSSAWSQFFLLPLELLSLSYLVYGRMVKYRTFPRYSSAVMYCFCMFLLFTHKNILCSNYS
uniref:Translocon-associated protein alpha subunit n=1 Tax=Rhizophora mucronata TaxID=61149 RepID=A0A2P2LMQ0_RHIMU